MKLLKAMATVAGLTGVSRIAGFVRDVMTAVFLGAGPVADAFFVALKLPNLFRRITAEGAFNVAFVPLYTEAQEQEGEDSAASFAGHSFAIMFWGLLLFTVMVWWAMPLIIGVIAPGFEDDGERYTMAVSMARVTFPYLLLISLTALLGGVLNAHDRFAPFAAAPIFFNVSLIAALLLADTYFPTAGHAMSWGVFAAGILQFGLLALAVKKQGVRIGPIRPVFNDRIKRLFILMGPGVIGAGVMQINLFVDLILASTLKTGSIAYLYYADRLNQLPLGIVGIAIGTALLPMMSKALAAGNTKEARGLFNQSMLVCLLLAMPAATGLLVAGYPIIVTLFEHGAFTSDATVRTARVLAAYSLGMPAYICSKVFQSAYWSRQDTATPVKISIKATIFNIGFSLWLIMYMKWDVSGIAFATSLAGWYQFYALKRGLNKIDAAALEPGFMKKVFKIIAACAVMGGVLFGLISGLAPVFRGDDDSLVLRIAVMAGIIGCGVLVYGALVLLTGAVDRKRLWRYIKR